MVFALSVLTIAFGGLGLIAHNLRNAPEAYEDETGFHLIRRRAKGAGVVLHRKAAHRSAATLKGARANP